MEPTKIPCLAKGIMAGLWVDLEASWGFASGKVPGITCRHWGLVVISWWVALVLLLSAGFWVVAPLWPASWLLVLDKGRGSKAAEVQRVWDIYDDRLQFMSWNDAFSLDGASDCGDVSLAWMIWSSAIEAALADAYRFAGGPVPDRGLVLGRGVF